MPYESVFLPKPHRRGIQAVLLTIGNTGAISPAATASGTKTYKVGTPYARAFLGRVSAQVGTKAAGAGTITAQVFKRNSVGSVNVALTGTFDLKTMVNDTVANIPISSGLSPSARSFRPGDYLALDIVASSTITTQPSDLFFTFELDLKD